MIDRTRVAVLTIIFAVAAGELYVAFLSSYNKDPFSVCASSNPPPSLDLPTLTSAFSKGDRAPEFTATDIDGNTIPLADLQGKVVVLNFMATWCQSCVWEAGRLVEVYNKYQGQDVVLLSIDIEPDGSLGNLLDFKSEYCADWTFVLDDGDLMSLYEVANLPTTYVIDKSGNIAYGHVGLIDVQEISNTIDTLLV
ncbi:MAG: peroxiredoxin family protein [Nitrososphaerales archaeon]